MIFMRCRSSSVMQSSNAGHVRIPFAKWTFPSDADAVRMHILSAAEEKEYFKRAQKSKNLHDCGRLMLNQGIRPDEAVCLRKVVSNSNAGRYGSRSEKRLQLVALSI